MAAACAPSRASLLTGHYPSLHGVTQTDGLAKTADERRHVLAGPGHGARRWATGSAPGGYRTFFKGKWHASHVALSDAEDGEGYLLSIDDDGHARTRRTSQRYLEGRSARRVRLLGVGRARAARPRASTTPALLKDVFTAGRDDRAAAADRRRRQRAAVANRVLVFESARQLNYFGVVGLLQGMRYHPSEVPSIPEAADA